MPKDPQARPATTRTSVWFDLVGLILVANGFGSALAAFFWKKQIGLVGVLDHYAGPTPWWAGLVMAAVGLVALAWMHRRGIRGVN